MNFGNKDFVPVVLGTGLNAYSVARSLHEAYGVRTLSLGRAPLPDTQHSRLLEVRTNRGLDTAAVLLSELRKVAEEFPDRPKVLFPLIELYATLVMEIRDELGPDFLIPLLSADVANQLMDKTDFYRTCAQLGVLHPQTVVVSPGSVDAVGTGLPFPYPVILKPSNTDIYPRLTFPEKQKVYVVETEAELQSIAERIFASGYDDDLIIQEYLAGDESVMRVVNTYSDRNGTMKVLSAGQVVLTERDPRAVGNYNAIASIIDDNLTATVRRLLDGTGYVGLANFDVMVDSATGQSKLLEVNLRVGASSYYTTAAGANIAQAVVEDLVYGREIPEEVTIRTRLWVHVPYLVALLFAPKSLRRLTRRAARNGGSVHTLKYGPDMSLKRRLHIAKMDLRRSLNYLRFRPLNK